MIPVRSERIYSIQSALKCARRELKLYIFTEVYDVTLVRAWRRCAVQIHEWMFRNKVNFSGFPCSGIREQWTLCREQWTLCREQWTLCREHVNRNTVHAWSALLTSLIIWIRCVNKERHAKHAERGGGGGGGGGARTGIENLCIRIRFSLYVTGERNLSSSVFHKLAEKGFKNYYKLYLFMFAGLVDTPGTQL